MATSPPLSTGAFRRYSSSIGRHGSLACIHERGLPSGIFPPPEGNPFEMELFPPLLKCLGKYFFPFPAIRASRSPGLRKTFYPFSPLKDPFPTRPPLILSFWLSRGGLGRRILSKRHCPFLSAGRPGFSCREIFPSPRVDAPQLTPPPWF